MQAPEPVPRNPEQCQRRIVLLGASVRAAAQSARAAGWGVLGIDLFGDPQTRSACQSFRLVEEVLAASDESLQDWLGPETPLLIVGGLTKTQQVVNRLLPWTKLVGATPALLKRLGHPTWLAELSAAVDISVPDHHLTTACSAAIPPTENANWLSKSFNSSGGLGVQWPQPAMPLQKPIDSTVDDTDGGDTYLQRWIAGRTLGVSFLSDGANVAWLGACRSSYTRRGQNPFVYAGSFGTVSVFRQHREQLQSLASELVRQTGYRGLLNVDAIVDRQSRLWLIEINPRWSGSSEIIQSALRANGQMNSDDSLLGWALDAAIGQSGLSDTLTMKHGVLTDHRLLKRIIYVRRGGRFALRRIESIETEFAGTIVVSDLPDDGATVRAGDPLLSVMVTFTSERPLAWRQLKRLFAKLQRAVDVFDEGE